MLAQGIYQILKVFNSATTILEDDQSIYKAKLFENHSHLSPLHDIWICLNNPAEFVSSQGSHGSQVY